MQELNPDLSFVRRDLNVFGVPTPKGLLRPLCNMSVPCPSTSLNHRSRILFQISMFPFKEKEETQEKISIFQMIP